MGLLQQLCSDARDPVLQTWGTHALAIVVEVAGFELGPYLRLTLGLCATLITTANLLDASLHQATGRLLHATITTFGSQTIFLGFFAGGFFVAALCTDTYV